MLFIYIFLAQETFFLLPQVSDTRVWLLSSYFSVSVASFAFNLEAGTFDTNDLIPALPSGIASTENIQLKNGDHIPCTIFSSLVVTAAFSAEVRDDQRRVFYADKESG